LGRLFGGRSVKADTESVWNFDHRYGELPCRESTGWQKEKISRKFTVMENRWRTFNLSSIICHSPGLSIFGSESR